MPFPDSTDPDDIPDYDSNKFVEDLLNRRPITIAQKKAYEIVGYIEDLEGMIPTDIEMQQGIILRKVFTSMDGQTYIEHVFWKGVHILNFNVNGNVVVADRIPYK